MNTFAVVVLCLQACLVQNEMFSQCLGAYAPAAAISPCSAALGAPFDYAGCADLAYPGALAGAYPYAGLGYPTAAYAGLGYPTAELAPYGGTGEGNVAVAGELPVAGTTAVAGQVPIMGAVTFCGGVPAAGAVSIAGKCTCDCGCASAPYLY